MHYGGFFATITLLVNTPTVSAQFHDNDDGNNGIEEDTGFYSSKYHNSVNSLAETIPGEAESDYPTYTAVPRTAFSCSGRDNWGYYADVEAGCQAFHVCQSQNSKISFLCPIGSAFNQRLLTCDWWYNFNCIDEEEDKAPFEDGIDFNPAGDRQRDHESLEQFPEKPLA